MQHLRKLRALSPAVIAASSSSSSKRAPPIVTAAIMSGGSRGFRNMVQQSAIRDSQRFPSAHRLSQAAGSDPHRRFFERSWTLSGPQQLEKLKLRIPGVTFVSVTDPHDDSEATGTAATPDWVAKILVTSDSPEALASVVVESRHRHRAAVYFSPTWSNQVPAQGNLVTEIVLPRGWRYFTAGSGMLRSLATTGPGLVVIEDDVLALHDDPDAVVKLAASRGSRLAVTASRNVDVRKLQVAAAQRGEVHMQAPNVAARGKLEVAGAGAGSVHLHSLGYLRSPKLSIAIAGDGHVRVHSENSLVVESMRSAIAGAGTVSVSVPGDGRSSSSNTASASAGARSKTDVACKTHRIGIFGSGSIDCADVVTEDVAVGVAGNAHVVVDAIEELKAVSFGTARVRYPHDPPRVSTRGRWHSTDPGQVPAALTDAEKNELEKQRAAELQQSEDFWRSLPSREAALESAWQVPFERESNERKWSRYFASSAPFSSSSCSPWSWSASKSCIPWRRATRRRGSWSYKE